MKRKLLSTLILSSILIFPGTVLGAEANTMAITQEEQQQINTTIANLEQEIKALRERVGKVEKKDSAKVAAKAPNNSDIKFWGDSRIRWINKHDDALKPFQERIRFGMSKDINDQVTMNIRLLMQDNNTFGSGNGVTDTAGKTDKDTVRVADANFVHKGLFGTDDVTIGRFTQKFLSQNYWITGNGGIDGIKVGLGGKSPLKVNVSYANWDVLTQNYIRNAYAVDVTYKVNEDTTMTGMYLKEVSSNTADKAYIPATSTKPAVLAVTGDKSMFDVRGVGIRTKLGGDFYFFGDYTNNVAMDKGIGYYYSLGYKEADKKIPQSWGLNLEYRKIGINNHVTSATGAAVDVVNVKGPVFAAHYVPAKNWIMNGYQTFGSKYAYDGAVAKGEIRGNNKVNYTRFEAVYNW